MSDLDFILSDDLDPATKAIARMRSPRDMHILCIDITNRCDLRCSNCTRLLANQREHWDMTPENFRTALRTLEGFSGVIAVIGGNPCLHPHFEELCAILRAEIINQRQRGLWSNNVFNHQQVIAETFGFFNLNPHNDARGIESLTRLREKIPGLPFYTGHSTHAPLLTAIRDLEPDRREMWDAISKCDINANWSASIVQNNGELRAYFCEVAASFDLARGTDHGVPVVPGWWNRGIDDFADQVRHFCPGCGVPARVPGVRDADEADTFTESNRDIATHTRGRRTVTLHTGAQPTGQRPVTSYSDEYYKPAAVPRISVVIPCYNAVATVADTIESVKTQRGPFELDIIVADDGSTDRSTYLAAVFGAKVIPSVNTGAAGARNRGAAVATGDFICFLDADDQYAPGFFEAAVNIFAANPHLAAILTGVEMVNLHREIDPVRAQAVVSSIPSNIILRKPIADLIGGFPEDAAFRGESAGEDIAWKQAIFAHFQVGRVDKPFLRYLVKRDSHFDRFMDNSSVIDGKLVVQPAPADLDGSLPRAATAYAERVRTRVSAVEACRIKR